MAEGLKTREVKAEDRKAGEEKHADVEEGLTHAYDVKGDAFGTIMKTVADGVVRAARGTGKAGISVPEAVTCVVRHAMQGSLDGSDLVTRAKAIVMGVIRGTGEKEDVALKTLSHAAHSIIHQTAGMTGDIAAAATGVVLGAIASAAHMGVAPLRAAAAARGAVIEEAERLVPAEAVRVRRALVKDVGEYNVVFPPPIM